MFLLRFALLENIFLSSAWELSSSLLLSRDNNEKPIFAPLQSMPLTLDSSSSPCLPLLRDLLDLLAGNDELDKLLERALNLMARHIHIRRGAITLVEPHTAKIRIEASFGLNASQRKKGEYARGEGITGLVIESGKAMYVADVAQEPLFLNRTGARDLASDKISFLCVPIFLGKQVVGALSVDLPWPRESRDEDELTLLQTIAALLAQTAHESGSKTESCHSEYRPPGFIGSSPAILQVYQQIEIVAPSRTTVCIFGESGTGKELAAHAIHAGSENSSGPFLSLNCAALPESLVESELFGHERGAFTGASHMRKGKFELANGGTLFLDEIGELSLFIQAKLLRVLQERVFERLGGSQTIQTDARLIAATNRNLAAMVEKGTFRRDLFYRLNVFPITLPSLAERLEDVPALASHFLEGFSKQNGKKKQRLSFAALDLLQRYAWPGNIRELQNVMERACLLAEADSLILPEHLPLFLQEQDTSSSLYGKHAKDAKVSTTTLTDNLEDLEKKAIIEAMKTSLGRIKKAAEALGMTERVLTLRLKKYGLDYKTFRKKNN